MSGAAGLRRRLTLGVLGHAVILSIAVALHGYVVNERAEQAVWESLLDKELSHFEKRRARDAGDRWADAGSLRLYGALNGVAAPPEFDSLSAGVHDEVARAGRQFVLLVRGSGAGKTVLALDISEMESRERSLAWTLAISSFAFVGLLALVTYAGIGRLIRPLTTIAQHIAGLLPDRRGQSIPVPARAPHEAVVIARALNDHLRRSDEFMDRELAFIRMTSHELRTPVAVIASTAEVALDARSASLCVDLHLRRIRQAAQEMKELLTLLLMLARDPARLRAMSETVDVGQLLPSIIQDHLFLAEHKQLAFQLHCSSRVLVEAPLQIVRAAVGNLVRNALENSDSGTIHVATSGGTRVSITDPGHGMTEREISNLFSRLARSGVGGAGGGIGLDLIQRVCAHFGWTLEMASQPGRGTSVVIDFGVFGRREVQPRPRAPTCPSRAPCT